MKQMTSIFLFTFVVLSFPAFAEEDKDRQKSEVAILSEEAKALIKKQIRAIREREQESKQSL